jgi:hypothetical protein
METESKEAEKKPSSSQTISADSGSTVTGATQIQGGVHQQGKYITNIEHAENLHIGDKITYNLPPPPPREKITWTIGQETSFFTGREEVIEQLHDKLQQSQTTALTQAISGLGGIGKTQTALRYANLYRREYEYGFWASASNQIELKSSFRKIAVGLGMVSDDEEQILEMFKA